MRLHLFWVCLFALVQGQSKARDPNDLSDNAVFPSMKKIKEFLGAKWEKSRWQGDALQAQVSNARQMYISLKSIDKERKDWASRNIMKAAERKMPKILVKIKNDMMESDVLKGRVKDVVQLTGAEASRYIMNTKNTHAEVTKLVEKDKKNVAKLYETMHEETLGLLSELEVNLAGIEMSTVPTEEEVEKETKLGEKEFKKLYKRMDRVKKYAEEQFERMENEHHANYDRLQKKQKDFKATQERIRNIVGELPDLVTQKVEKLAAFNEGELTEREEMVEGLQEHAETSLEKLSEVLEGISEHVGEGFEKYSENAQGFKETSLQNLDDDMETFTDDSMDGLYSVRGAATEQTERLIRKGEATEGILQNVAEKLLEQGKTEKTFPSEAATTMAKVGEYMSQEFMAARENRQEMMGKGIETFEKKMKETKVTTLEKISEKQQSEIAAGGEAVRQTKKSAQREIVPSMEKMREMAGKVEGLEDTVGDAKVETEEAQLEISALPKEISAADKLMNERIHDEDYDLKDYATDMQATIMTDVKNQMTKTHAAEAKAVGQLAAAEKKASNTFKKTASGVERAVTGKVTATERSVDKLEQMGTKAAAVLNQKVHEANLGIQKVEEVDMPTLKDAVKDFMDDSSKRVADGPGLISNTFNLATTAVDAHMDGLQHLGQMARDSIPVATNPVMQKLIGRAKTQTDGLENDITQMNTALGESGVTVNDLFAETAAQNNKNEKALDASSEQMENSFKNAQSAIGAESAKVATLQQEQNAKIQAVNAVLDKQIDDAVAGVSNTVEKEATETETKMSNEVGTTKDEVESYEDSLAKVVNDATAGIGADRAALTKSSGTVQGIIAEAEAQLGVMKATVGQGAKNFGNELKAEAAADRETHRDLSAAVNDATAKAMSEAETAFENSAHDGKAAIEAEQKESEGDQEASAKTVEATGTRLEQTISRMRATASSEIQGAESKTDKLRAQITQESRSEAQQDKAMKKRFDEIENQGEKQNEEFQKGMDNAKILLSTMAGKDHAQMNDLMEKLDDLAISSQDKVRILNAADAQHLNGVVIHAKGAAGEVGKKVAETQKKVEDFTTKLADADEKSQGDVDTAVKNAGLFEDKFAEQTRLLTKRLNEEEIGRKASADTLMMKAQTTGKRLTNIMGSVDNMERKVTAGVQYQLGSLDLEEKKVDRQLREAVKINQYTDAGALRRVVKDAEEAEAREERLLDWKHAASRQQDHFRKKVQQEFGKLGHELDLTSLEEAEQKAMEEWAVQQQMGHLKEVLGAEMQDLSGASKARLAALAQRSGAEIAALMANKDLTDEERAKKLAEIKERARLAAQKILEDNGQLALDQKTAARRLKLATKEVEDSGDQIASLDGASNPRPGVDGVVDRVQDLIRQADFHIASTDPNHEAEEVEITTDPIVKPISTTPVEDAAAANDIEPEIQVSLPEPAINVSEDAAAANDIEPASLFEAAALQSEQAIEEDENWSKSLRSLESKVDTVSQ